MQSICGEIFFLFFNIDCWFTLEWWENKAVPAECWREAFICFIDLVHFCEMFSMYFSIWLQNVSTNGPGSCTASVSWRIAPKEELRICKWFFCWRSFLSTELCPLDVDRHNYNLYTFSDLDWLSSLTVWQYEWNGSLGIQTSTFNSLLSTKPGRSWLLTSKQGILSFQKWSFGPWLLIFYKGGKSFLFKNKMTVLLLIGKLFIYLKDSLFKNHSVKRSRKNA